MSVFVDLTSDDDDTDIKKRHQTEKQIAKPANAFSVLMGASRKVFSPTTAQTSSVDKISQNPDENAQQQSSTSSNRRWMNKREGGFRSVPGFKLIQFGKMTIPIVVDGFYYSNSQLSDTYFLTHFHSDHYGGLSSKFAHGKIYCTQTTANLVNLRLHVPLDRVIPLELNKQYTITMSDGVCVYVTLFDANHCPGAACFIFNTDHSSETVLHTGDFRFNPSMLSQCPTLSELAARSDNSRLLTIYLDTTYCDPTYSFPPQEETLDAVVASVQAELGLVSRSDQKNELTRNIPLAIVDLSNEEDDENNDDGNGIEVVNNIDIDANEANEMNELINQDLSTGNQLKSEKLLFLFGAYGIGKERVYMRVAESINRKVHVDSNRRRVMGCYSDWSSNMYGK